MPKFEREIKIKRPRLWKGGGVIGNNPTEGKRNIAAMPAAEIKRQIQHKRKKE